MDRDQATSLLESETDGTYLVRIRPQGPTRSIETIYALSLKYIYNSYLYTGCF